MGSTDLDDDVREKISDEDKGCNLGVYRRCWESVASTTTSSVPLGKLNNLSEPKVGICKMRTVMIKG